jgi:hypothetical protein
LESGLLPLSILLLAILMPSCGIQKTGALTATLTSVPGTDVSSNNITPSPTPICTSLPSGMSVTVIRTSPDEVLITLKGFQSGEKVSMTFNTIYDNSATRFENGPISVGQDGSYQIYQKLSVSTKRSNLHWLIQVIYSRGVACSEIDMP